MSFPLPVATAAMTSARETPSTMEPATTTTTMEPSPAVEPSAAMKASRPAALKATVAEIMVVVVVEVMVMARNEHVRSPDSSPIIRSPIVRSPIISIVPIARAVVRPHIISATASRQQSKAQQRHSYPPIVG